MSQFFEIHEKLDVSELPCVYAEGDIQGKLAELKSGPPDNHSVVVNVAKIEEGRVREIGIKLVDHPKRPHLVIQASRLFPNCPPDKNLTIRRDYSLMHFPPGSLASTWTPASHYELSFWGKWVNNTRDSTPATPEETESWGLTDFMLRAYLVPHVDPRLASIELVAMPVSVEDFKKLPDIEKAQVGLGYPCVFIHSGSKKPVILAPKRRTGDTPNGLPFVPVLIVGEEDREPLDGNDLVVAFRKLWHGSCIPATFTIQEWLERTKKSPVSTAEVEATHKWPLVSPPPKQPTQEPSEDARGKIFPLNLN